MSLKVPGVIYPEVNQYPAGANSARTAGIVNQNASVAKQTNLLKTANGGGNRGGNRGSRKKHTYFYGGQIAVPQFNVLYNEPGTGGQTVNNNVIGTTQLGSSSAKSSSFDVCIGQGPACTAQVIQSQKGGQKGGLKWGCYSGGIKRKKTTKRRKIRKPRKTRNTRKTRKTKKSRRQ
jgi:hypothetical protein